MKLSGTTFIDIYDELDKLNEAYESNYLKNGPDYSASRTFWVQAKDNVIAVEAFHKAYDAELNKLGLLDQFDDNGMVKSKPSYGIFKKANQESWAVKAALKFCGLQFWSNAVTLEDKRKHDEDERNKQIEDSHKAFVEYKPKLVDLVKKLVDENIDFKPFFEKMAEASRLRNEIDTLNGRENPAPLLPNTDFTVTVEMSKENDEGHCYIDVIAKGANETEFSSKVYCSAMSFRDPDNITIEEDTRNNVVNGVGRELTYKVDKFDKDIEFLSSRLEDVKEQKRRNDEIEQLNKDATSAVNEGKQPSEEFINKITEVADKALKTANEESAEWASWSGDDGDSGAAYESEINKGASELDKYLHGLKWESDESTYLGGSEEDYERAVKNLIYNGVKDIKFVK